MTSGSQKMLREHRARERFERNLALLLLELQQGAPRRHLDAVVELLEGNLALAGNSLVTARFRELLAGAKAEVETRTNLRVVPMTPTPITLKVKPIMQYQLAAAAQCDCGNNVTVSYNALGRCFQAICENCYDGTEDAGSHAHCAGHGETPDEAVSEWLERHEDASSLEFWPHPASLDWLVKVETNRQRGWTLKNGYWGPASAAANHNG